MESHATSWRDLKHKPAMRADVTNPIRVFFEREVVMPKDHILPFIGLGLGEPTVANGFTLPAVINEAIIEAVQSGTANGYTAASGAMPARAAIAAKFSTVEHPVDPNNVFITFGCSGALQNAMAVLCESGDKILVPAPGFPLFQPICQNLGVEWDFYQLDASKNWEIDLDSLAAKIDSRTKAILVNNPSNPCGSCWTKEHMEQILAISEKYKVPLISDEVYYGLSYEESRPFHSFGTMTSTVPVICCGSISKIYCLPGWRCGWTIVYNNQGYFDKVIDNLGKHAMILLHPASIVQSALPRILSEVKEDHFEGMKQKLQASSNAAFKRFSSIQGIKPIASTAAMYMMVGIDIDYFADITDDVDFVKKLLAEQNCLVFPSTCFFQKNFFRLVLCTKPETLIAFGDRLEEFCKKHAK